MSGHKFQHTITILPSLATDIIYLCTIYCTYCTVNVDDLLENMISIPETPIRLSYVSPFLCSIVICFNKKLIRPLTNNENFQSAIQYSLGMLLTNRELIAYSLGRHFSAEAIHFSSYGTLMDRPK